MSRSLRLFENSGENALDSSGSTGNLLDRENENPNHRKSNRYFVFHELLQTETNYVEVLNTIINNFKEPLYSSQLIPSREFWKIFGKRRFEDLRVVHEHILSSMQQLDRHWTEKALVGQVWATALDDFRRVYIPTTRSRSSSTTSLPAIRAFAKLIQELEAKSRDKKYRLEDLLIRPIQRLTSVNLLLQRLLKATPEKNPDRQWLQQAQIAVGTCPRRPELVNSNCLFVASADFRVLKGRRNLRPNQYLTFAKRRIQRTESTGFNHSANTTFGGTLQRNPSFITFMKPKERVRKPFKHLETIRFPDVREVTYLEQGGIFFVRLRDTMSEECTALQIARDTDGRQGCRILQRALPDGECEE
ncbi:Protein ECT2 [Aphelenchoides fujianensis]|nr:Protein ECT2 [Aphelenchoides fujianensis]